MALTFLLIFHFSVIIMIQIVGLLPPDAFPRLKICQQCVCSRTTVGELTVLARPLAGKGRGAPRKVGTPERGREEEKGRTGGGGRGKLLPPDVRFYR